MLDLNQINKKWTLFLDRDGVINREKQGSYVFRPEEFEFYEGVLEALRTFAGVFGTIVVVTNQRGIGRGLMTEENLQDIHQLMLSSVQAAGGRIDRIYYCPSLDDDHPNRKPLPGMARLAMKDFPQIDPKQSIMIGNNLSDMEFGRNAGLHTILLHTTGTTVTLPHPLVDLQFGSLEEVARKIMSLMD